ncbi:MAG: glutamyl-tRNA reductase [Gemmataceae bacterium]|nr:glutamyl-tRNA reductase [Gemmataceae bacterium]
MKLLLVGCSVKKTPIELREKLAFDGPKLPAALRELESRYGVEAVVLSTCNRVEMYLARAVDHAMPTADLIGEFLAEFHHVAHDALTPHLYERDSQDAVRHLFRVASSLDSLIIGEGQIAGQVKQAYETAHVHAAAGPILHALFQHAATVAKKVRTQTGISRGHVSVASVAVDYVRQVFDHFDDKTVLVIGAGKMGVLTLRRLRDLKPRRILVANRSPEKAVAVAQECGGQAIAWDQLDDALAKADIVLSTTGAPEPIMTQRRFNEILPKRTHGPIVIFDMAVPRDFDPAIHDGDQALLFNVDDLKQLIDATLKERRKHVAPAEEIIEREVRKFVIEWTRRRNGPIIAKLTQDFESRRRNIVSQLLTKLDGKLDAADKAYVEGAFRLLQNQYLHGPISALAEEAQEPGRHTLLDALRKLFRIED